MLMQFLAWLKSFWRRPEMVAKDIRIFFIRKPLSFVESQKLIHDCTGREIVRPGGGCLGLCISGTATAISYRRFYVEIQITEKYEPRIGGYNIYESFWLPDGFVEEG